MTNRMLAACLVVPWTASCSALFMTKAPEPVPVPSVPVDCTTSRAAPVLDVLGATYFVFNTLYWIGRTECTAFRTEGCSSSDMKVGGALLSVGLTGLYAASAYTGFTKVTRCEAIKELNARCMGGDGGACQKLNPSWVPPPAGQPWPVSPAPAPLEGCTKDVECKGVRICVQGTCVDPPPRQAPPPPMAPPRPPDSCERDADCDYGICTEGRCRR
jgi:hypothetical protein